MAIKLNNAGFEHAESMIKRGVEVEHFSKNWKEVKPDTEDELRYIDAHSLEEYGQWYLGIDTDIPKGNRKKYVYPIGDFNVLQESAIIEAEIQAKKNHHDDIAAAAQKLHSKIVHSKK